MQTTMRCLTPALRGVVAIGAALLCAVAAPAALAAYPDKQIKLVVPFPPGGNVDITTRIFSTALARELKQSIVIENLGGAAGSIGAANVARAAPDGYTLVSTTLLTMLVNPVINPSLKVRLSDFQTAGILGVVPCVLEVTANNRNGIKDFQGFLTYARAHPDMSIGHGGNGTMNHLVTLLLEREYGLKLNAIPYKGAAPALVDLLGNQVDSMVDQLSGSQAQIQGGAVIPLATTASKRIPGMPNVPTFAELGKPSMDMVTYSVLMSPKGTPPDVMETLNRALLKVAADPDVLKQLQAVGASAMTANLTQARDIVAHEEKQLGPLLTGDVLKPER